MPRPALPFLHPTTSADRRHLADLLREETVGGLAMAVAAVVAVLWANVLPESYLHITHARLGSMSISHWMSDGLLTVFFLVAGMELKRELVEGSLRNPKSALVPVFAAICGMVIPAVLYTITNMFGHGDLRGWAIPMATDIAFALAVLAIVGSQLPSNLRAFLLTLAIVDDLGAIIVIAVFYAHGLQLIWLVAAAVAATVWWLLQRIGVRSWWLYVPVGLACWYATLQSGVHATISGVILGLLVRTSLTEDDDPLDRWLHAIHPWSAGLVVPLFALTSAGVRVTPDSLRTLVTHPVPLGVLLGLVIGKLIGVFGGAFATATLIKQTPCDGVRWREVLGVAQLAGIGFTVSLLLTELSFPDNPAATAQAKTAVLAASLLSALIGGFALRPRSHMRARTAKITGQPASPR